jgi:hypothetical protein
MPENPAVITLKSELDAAKLGIISSLDTYSNQMYIKLASLDTMFASSNCSPF